MDLIYATHEREDIGILQDYTFDLAYGRDENDFSLTIDLSKHCMQDDYIVYMVDTQDGVEAPTEYGGIIDGMSVDTTQSTVTYTGRTWHGILEEKVIEPEQGQSHRTVTGDAHDILRELITASGLDGLFTCVGPSEITIAEYQFKRYTDLYSGICEMLAENGGKLQLVYQDKMVHMSAVWLVDYSDDEEWDSGQVSFRVQKTLNPVNHLVCLGQGDMQDRAVIHLFTDDNGGVQPYTFTDDPIKDSDYILDKRNQVLFGDKEVCEVFEDSAAEITENYVVMQTQPSDWMTKYENYFTKDDDGEDFEQVQGEDVEVLTPLVTQPSDWTTKYSKYATSSRQQVEGVESVTYKKLTAKPADWEKNWSNYYVHYWDGVRWYWNGVDSVSWTSYHLQTAKPSDWNENFNRYYERKSVYKTVKVGKTTKKKKVGVGYVSVSKVKKGKKEVVPTWRKNKYYTGYSHQKAPNFKSGLDKYMQVTATVAPAWESGKYYTLTEQTIAPAWKKNTFYRAYEDRYAELVCYGIERLKELQTNSDRVDINLDLLGEYDIGDIVGAYEATTGVSVWQPITKKIVSIKNNQKSISYTIGAGL
jgi:hypothetical protein